MAVGGRADVVTTMLSPKGTRRHCTSTTNAASGGAAAVCQVNKQFTYKSLLQFTKCTILCSQSDVLDSFVCDSTEEGHHFAKRTVQFATGPPLLWLEPLPPQGCRWYSLFICLFSPSPGLIKERKKGVQHLGDGGNKR